MILIKLRSRKNSDIEMAVARAFAIGVITGIQGARGEEIPDSSGQDIIIAATASIQGSPAANLVNRGNVAAIMANPIHHESTYSILKNYSLEGLTQ